MPRNPMSRRSLLKTVPVIAGIAAFGAELMPDTAGAQTKVPHDVAKYQETPKNGQECSTCVQFQPPGSCKLVVDPIDPHAWCIFYAKKS